MRRALVLCTAVAALSMGGAFADNNYCLWCDYPDGTCCETTAILTGGCLAACPDDYVGLGQCEGYGGPCRTTRGNCVYGWDKTCCEARGGYIDQTCPAPDAVPPSDEEVVEPLDADCDDEPVAEATVEADECATEGEVDTCPADRVSEEVGPGQEDAFCYCPGGRCCGSQCWPGARCCSGFIGYECCSSADCFGGSPCIGHRCILEPD